MQTKALLQAEHAQLAEALFAASVLFNDDIDIHQDADLEGGVEDEIDENEEDSDIFEIFAFNCLSTSLILGDTSRGPYTNIPRSSDYFAICLSAPDRQFCRLFRYVLQ